VRLWDWHIWLIQFLVVEPCGVDIITDSIARQIIEGSTTTRLEQQGIGFCKTWHHSLGPPTTDKSNCFTAKLNQESVVFIGLLAAPNVVTKVGLGHIGYPKHAIAGMALDSCLFNCRGIIVHSKHFIPWFQWYNKWHRSPHPHPNSQIYFAPDADPFCLRWKAYIFIYRKLKKVSNFAQKSPVQSPS
jgi:hypothetical protein